MAPMHPESFGAPEQAEEFLPSHYTSVREGKKRKRDISPNHPFFTGKPWEKASRRPRKEASTVLLTPSWDMPFSALDIVENVSTYSAVNDSSYAEGPSRKVRSGDTSKGWLDPALGLIEDFAQSVADPVREMGSTSLETLATDVATADNEAKPKCKRRRRLFKADGAPVKEDVAALIIDKIGLSYLEANSFECPFEGCEAKLGREVLKNHLNSHYKYKKCCPTTNCARQFNSATSLSRHISDHHLHAFDLSCKTCKTEHKPGRDDFSRDDVFNIRRHANQYHEHLIKKLSAKLGYDVMAITAAKPKKESNTVHESTFEEDAEDGAADNQEGSSNGAAP